MRKLNFKIMAKYFMVIIWMIVIFKFSSDPAQISDSKSNKVINFLTYIGINVNDICGELASFIIRKMGHIIEYFILCFLCFFAIKDNLSLYNAMKASLFITIIYACSDEIHQLFIPGRSGRIVDVFIDTMGALLSIITIYMVSKLKEKLRLTNE